MTTAQTPPIADAATTAPAKGRKRRDRRSVTHGKAFIQSTFNNTTITLNDTTGAVLSWATAGAMQFKGSRKGTAFAAQRAAEEAAKRSMDHGLRQIEVLVKGTGTGREAAIRALQATGLSVTSIRDVTPAPHNGCRPPKRRRV